ncbi:ATP-binding protein [Gorillibacterium sp. CAU 1737]|uniref:ATP-binding protein n=1 Tax=Gorillibacterium sp. CAU 1737 TaxID=3140362 RepID=UPI00325FF1E9
METDVIRLVYSSFFRSAPYGIAIINRKAIILQANDAFLTLCGIPLKEVVGFPLFSLTHHEDQWEERERFRSFTASELKETTYETRWLLPDGSIRQVHTSLSRLDSGPASSSSWFLASYTHSCVPSSLSLNGWKSLAKHNDRSVKAGHWELCRCRSPRLFFSNGLYGILGITGTAAHLTEEMVLERADQEDLNKIQAASTSGSFSGMVRIRAFDNSMRRILITGERDESEECGCSVWSGTFQDVTELEQAKESLHRHRALNIRIHESFQDIVCLIHKDLRISALSQTVYTFSGYSEDELERHTAETLLPSEDLQLVRAHLNVSQGQPITFRVRVKNGTLFWLEAVIIPYPLDSTPDEHYLVVARNRTDVMTMHEQALNSDKLNAVGGLAAGIAHEIRNPLTAIRGFIQLMKGGTVKPEFHDIILSELSRIDSIVKELLFLSKPQPVVYASTELYPLLDHVVTLISTQAILCRIELELDHQAGSLELLCDENQIKQVLINLLKNAIEAMPNGGKIILQTDKPSDQSVRIQIIDQGEGISQEELARIGQRFYSTKKNGTGLGMMISQEIIRNHGGRMSLRSTPGVGTTVDILLPVTQ